MRNRLLVASFLFLGTSMFFSKAEAEDGMKIRYAGGQRVLGSLDEAKQAEKEIAELRQSLEVPLKQIESQLQMKASALQQKAKASSPAVLEKEREEIEKLQRDGKNMTQEADTKLRREFDRKLGGLNQKMKVEIDKLRAQKRYDLVVLEEGGIISADPKYDITQEVVDFMNVEYKKAKAPAAKPAAAVKDTATKK